MNYIAATVDIVAHSEELVTTYGEHAQASAVIPGNGPQASVKLRLLCHNGGSAKLAAFKNLKTGTRAFITGNIFFAHKDTSSPLDVIVVTLEPTVPQSMYCNQVVLGNAFFTAGKDEIKDQKSGNCAVNIATSLDNSDDVTYLKMEIEPSRKPKLESRIRKGRQLCVQGYIREFRDGDFLYRAIVASDFTNRKDFEGRKQSVSTGTATGYAEQDPLPPTDFG